MIIAGYQPVYASRQRGALHRQAFYKTSQSADLSSVRFGERFNRWANITGALCFVAGMVFWGKHDYEQTRTLSPEVIFFGLGTLSNLASAVRRPKKPVNDTSSAEAAEPSSRPQQEGSGKEGFWSRFRRKR